MTGKAAQRTPLHPGFNPAAWATRHLQVAMPVPADPGLADTAFQWLSANWQTLGLLLVAVAGVVVLRGMIRSAQTTPLSTDSKLPAANLASLAAEEPDEEDRIDSRNGSSSVPIEVVADGSVTIDRWRVEDAAVSRDLSFLVMRFT